VDLPLTVPEEVRGMTKKGIRSIFRALPVVFDQHGLRAAYIP
jgi:hypothetical protein